MNTHKTISEIFSQAGPIRKSHILGLSETEQATFIERWIWHTYTAYAEHALENYDWLVVRDAVTSSEQNPTPATTFDEVAWREFGDLVHPDILQSVVDRNQKVSDDWSDRPTKSSRPIWLVLPQDEAGRPLTEVSVDKLSDLISELRTTLEFIAPQGRLNDNSPDFSEHNSPLSAREVQEVLQNVKSLEVRVSEGQTDKYGFASDIQDISSNSSKIKKWLGERATKGVDAAVKGAAAAAGASAVLMWQRVGELLDQISSLIGALF